MPEKITKEEVKKTIAVAIGSAFGFIIALLWKDVIIALMKSAELWTTANTFDTAGDAAITIITVIIITIVCVFGILYISKWGGVKKE